MHKKYLIILLFLSAIFLPTKANALNCTFSGGNGTKENPYQLTTTEDILAVGSCGANANYKLMTDIDFTGVEDPKLVGDDNAFRGTFDGNNHSLLNIKIAGKETSYQGLFGTNYGTIKNLTISFESFTDGHQKYAGVVSTNEVTGLIDNVTTTSNKEIGFYQYDPSVPKDKVFILALLAATNKGTIKNSTNKAVVNFFTMGINYGGGLVGINLSEGILYNLNNLGPVGGGDITGGVVGINYGTATKLYNAGKIFSASGTIGGVIGAVYSETVSDLHNSGTISYDYYNIGGTIGGVIGLVESKNIFNITNTGDIINKSLYDIPLDEEEVAVGGLVGEMRGGTLTDANNTGTIQGHANTGGIVGRMKLDALLDDVYNTGKIASIAKTTSGRHFDYTETAGGIVGELVSGTIKNSYNSGEVISDTNTGGIAGKNAGTIENCYNKSPSIVEGDSSGGISGFNTGLITHCYNSGTSVTGLSPGGIAGSNEGIIEYCHNSGSEVSGTRYVGGITGENYNTVTNCYNEGRVINRHWQPPSYWKYTAAGIVGTNVEGIIANSYNTGYIKGTALVGGIAGSNTATIKSTYNTGKLESDKDIIGGITAETSESATIENSYYLESTGLTKLEGTTPLTQEEFSNKENLVGFNTNNWSFDGVNPPTLTEKQEMVYLKGDLNNNGDIDLTDILLELKIFFTSLNPTDYQKVVGDMNDDNTINLTDVLLLLKAFFAA